jgi:predicted nucleotidyltransferase component of viral defense system
MKEVALSLLKDLADPARKLNILREYIQVETLRSLHESEAFVNLTFVGGTAIRFVFDLPRFSEDLDFSMEKADGYKPELWMKKLKNDLMLAGFDTSMKWNDRTAVHKAWIKVEGLLHEAGLAAMKDQKLSIKLEIDTNPPAGAQSQRDLITRHAMLSINHYDLHSLMAGKVHALITREYAKGRDWYDLLWYRGRRPPVEPNLELLQNAMDQTRGEGVFNAVQWKHHLMDTVGELDFSALAADVRPFLEHQEEATLLRMDNFRSALR